MKRYWLPAVLLLCCSLALATGPGTAETQPQPQPAPSRDKPALANESRYPLLESGELGKQPEDSTGQDRSWNRALPFLAQKVIDLGFDLPNPYGAGVVLAHVEQDIVLSELQVGFNGGEKQPVDFVDFNQSTAQNNAAQLKLDTWVFPFMNVYAVLGRFDGEAVIPISVPGSEALKFLLPEVGKLCDRPAGFPGRLELCDQLLTGTALPKYEGTNIGIGMTLAMGWKNYFVAIPATYVRTDINIVDSSIDTVQVAPRIGFTMNLNGPGMLAFYTGGSWMDIDLELSGQVTLSAPGTEPDQVFNIDYTVREQGRQAWNYLAGFNWDVNSHWSVMAEIGFGGARDHLISSIVYRW